MFSGGPIDGHAQRCAAAPPPVFFLPTQKPLTASVYCLALVDARQPSMVAQYDFTGYLSLSSSEAEALFATALVD